MTQQSGEFEPPKVAKASEVGGSKLPEVKDPTIEGYPLGLVGIAQSGQYPLAIASSQHAALLDRYKRNHNLNALHVVTKENLDDFHITTGKQFSKFKYGDPESIKFFAQEIADQMVETHGREALIENAYILAPAYRNVKTSAVLLAEAVQVALQEAHGIEVETVRLSRRQVSGGDYGLLKTMEARAAQIFHKFNYDGPNLEKAKVFFIEDTLVSGAHYLETQRALEEDGGIKLENIHSHFIADVHAESFGDERYAVEDVLNHLWVSKKEVSRLTEILSEPGIVTTPRTLKLLLESPWVQVEATLDTVPLDVVLQIEHGARSEELSNHAQYAGNYNHLQNYAMNRLKAFKEGINLNVTIQVDEPNAALLNVPTYKHPRFERLLTTSELYSLLKFGDTAAIDIFAHQVADSIRNQFNGKIDPATHCIAAPSYVDAEGSAALLSRRVSEILEITCVEVKRTDIPKVSYGMLSDAGKRHEVVKQAVYKVDGKLTKDVILIEDSVVSGSNIKALGAALRGQKRTIHPQALINLDTLSLELEEKLNSSIISANDPQQLIELLNQPNTKIVARTVKEVFASGAELCELYAVEISLNSAVIMANLGRINGFHLQSNYATGFNSFVDKLNERIREEKDLASHDGTSLPAYEALYILGDGDAGKLVREKFAASYSRAKYGDLECMEQYAQDLAKMIRHRLGDEIYKDSKNWVIAGTHFFRTPNAASHLTRRVATLLELPVADIRRRDIFEGEFGALSDPESRKKAMEGQTVVSVPQQVADKNVIYIDDLYASGTHLKEHCSAITNAGAKKIVPFALIDIAVADLSAEAELNYAGFSSAPATEVTKILTNEDAPLLTRTMKILLKLPTSEFEEAIAALPTHRIFELAEQSKLEGYHKTESMKANCELLEAHAHSLHQQNMKLGVNDLIANEYRLMLFDFDETLGKTLTPLSDEMMENLVFFLKSGVHIGVQSLQPIGERGLTDNVLSPLREYVKQRGEDVSLLAQLHLIPDQGVSAYRVGIDGELATHPIYRVGFSEIEWQKLQDIVTSSDAGTNAVRHFIRGGYISLHYASVEEMEQARAELEQKLSDFPTEVVFSTKTSQDKTKHVLHIKSAVATKMIGRQYMLNEVAQIAGIRNEASARSSILVAGDKMGISSKHIDDAEMLVLGGVNLALGKEVHPSANGLYAGRRSEGLLEFLTLLRRSQQLVLEN